MSEETETKEEYHNNHNHANLTEEQVEERYKSLRSEIESLRERISSVMRQKSTSNSNSQKLLKDNANRFTLEKSPAFRCRRNLEGHFGKIYALHWSHGECDRMVSASQDGKLLIWNVNTTNKRLAINLKSSWVMTCCYSLNNGFVAGGGLDSICSIYDVSSTPDGGWHSDKASCELRQHEGYLSCCRYLDDQQMLTSSGDGTSILWDVEKALPIRTFDSKLGDIECLDVHREKSIFVTGGIDSVCCVWDYRDDYRSRPVMTLKEQQDGDITCIKFFPDGNAFVSGCEDNSIHMFDLKSFSLCNKYHNKQTIRSAPTSMDFTASGYYLITGHEDASGQNQAFCYVWNTQSAEIEKELTHSNKVSFVQTAPNGNAFATGCWDKVVRVWA